MGKTASGGDNPLKYPATVYHADLLVLNKIDLLHYVPFAMESARGNARRVQPEIEIVDAWRTSRQRLKEWNDRSERPL